MIAGEFYEQTGEEIAAKRSEAVALLDSITEIEFDSNTNRYFSKSKKSEHIAELVFHQKSPVKRIPATRKYHDLNNNNSLNRTNRKR